MDCLRCFNKKRKGISPLVAVVLLIAFTLVIAGILASWITQFSTEQRDVIQKCTEARVLILSTVFDSNVGSIDKARGDYTLNIHNYGTVDLNFRVLVTYTNETIQNAGEIEIKEGEVGQFTFFDVRLDSIREVTVQSDVCTGAQDFAKAEDAKKI